MPCRLMRRAERVRTASIALVAAFIDQVTVSISQVGCVPSLFQTVVSRPMHRFVASPVQALVHSFTPVDGASENVGNTYT
jgi:hypothetical protein